MTMILQDSGWCTGINSCTATVTVPSPTQITAQGRWRRWNSQHISSQYYSSKNRLWGHLRVTNIRPKQAFNEDNGNSSGTDRQHHRSDDTSITSNTPSGTKQSVTTTRQRMNRRLRMTMWMTDLCFAKVEARCRHCHPVMMTGILRFGWIARRCTLRSDVPLDLGPNSPQLSCRYLQYPHSDTK